MDRRNFLLISGSAVAVAATTGSDLFLPGAHAAAAGGSSLGYWNATLTRTKTGALIPGFRDTSISAASALTIGDPSFLGTYGIARVEGLCRRSAPEGSIDVDFVVPLENGGETRVQAWSYRREGALVNEAKSASLNIHPQLTAPFEIVMETRPAARSGRGIIATQERIELSMGHENGPKLRPGVYFVAIREQASDSLPEWSDYRVATGSPDSPLRVEGEGFLRHRYTGAPASFPYVVISIERSINVDPPRRVAI